jgi:PIN domain nuclease of toxin-antitoxin system
MILLDTHTAVLLASDQSKLSADAEKAISLHADKLHISVVSAWEISMIYRRNILPTISILLRPFQTAANIRPFPAP